jgi:hypothetical protein
MAIQEFKKKLHLIGFDIKKGRDVDESPAPTVTITSGSIRFGRRAIDALQMNGKFVRFFYAQGQNIIGFQMKEKAMLGAMNELKGDDRWKMVNQNGKTGLWTVSVRKLMDQYFDKGMVDKMYSDLPIQKYTERQSTINKGETWYIIEIDPNNETTPRKNGKKGEPSPLDLDDVIEKVTA